MSVVGDLWTVTALQFNCASGLLYGLTAGAGAGDLAYKNAHSLIKINKATAAVTVVCPMVATDLNQAFAFVDPTTIMYFVGSTTPLLYLLRLASVVSATASCPITAGTTHLPHRIMQLRHRLGPASPSLTCLFLPYLPRRIMQWLHRLGPVSLSLT